MSFPLYYAFDGASPPERAGAAHAAIYPYGPFEVANQQTVMLGLQNEREWKAFCEIVLEQAELSTHPQYLNNSLRHQNRDKLKAIIDAVLMSLSKEDVINRLERAGIANASVNDMHGVWQHPQLQARNRWATVDSPVGELPALLPPGKNNQFNYRMGAIPALGEHTQDILRALAFDEEQIHNMQEKGVI